MHFVVALSLALAAFADPAPKLYVANSAGNDLHVIDTATNRVLKRVEVGPQPHGLVATKNGERLFLTIENTEGDEGEFVWFDPATDSVTRRMTIGPRPNQLACTPDGKIAYVPCDDASWWVIDTVKGEVIKKIPTGGRPHNTLCSLDGRFMYLGPKGSYHVLIADTTTHKLVGEIKLSDAPRPIALSRDGKRLYANVDTLLGFEVADLESRRVIHRVEAEVPAELLRTASRSHGIGLRPGEKELWMCDVFHDRTYVFDLTTEPPKQIATITMKGGGYWLCFSPDGKRCYISERIGDSVAVIDTATKEVTARIAVGKAPKRNLVLAAADKPGEKPDEKKEETEEPYNSKTHGSLRVTGDTGDWFTAMQDGKQAHPGNPPKLGGRVELLPGKYEVLVNKTKRVVTIHAGKETTLRTGTLVVEGAGTFYAPYEGDERRVASNPPVLGSSIALFPGTYSVRVQVFDKSVKLTDNARIVAGEKTVLKK
jgi:YVTN family beta-propeller protein